MYDVRMHIVNLCDTQIDYAYGNELGRYFYGGSYITFSRFSYKNWIFYKFLTTN